MALRTPARKRYGLFAMSVALILASGAFLLFGGNSLALRCAGVIACIASVGLVKISNVRATPGMEEGKRLAPIMWVIGAALLISVGIAYLLLQLDAAGGYKEMFPVYLFAGSVIICGVFWGYLLSRYS